LFLVLTLIAAIGGCRSPSGDSAADHEENQKVGANAD
jgi:hypothetical protein